LSKHKLSTAFDVVLSTANVALCDIILESESGGYKIYEDLDCSSGSLTQSVQILASDGFSANELIYIYAQATIGIAEDSRQIQSIATLTMEAPALTAGIEGTITGTSDGIEVDVYSRISETEDDEAGEWELFDGTVAVDESGNWTATGTIADAGTRDFIAVDTTDPDGFVQVDDVEVASGVMTAALQITNDPDAAVKGNTFPTKAYFFEGDIIVHGSTTSSSIRINDVDYATGYSSGAAKGFVARITKAGVVSWLTILPYFSECHSSSVGYNGDIYCVDGDYTSNTVGKVYQVDGTTGSVTTSKSLGGSETGYAVPSGIGVYNDNIYVIGYVWAGGPKVTVWMYEPDLTGETITKGTAIGAHPNGAIFDGKYIVFGSVDGIYDGRVDMDTMTITNPNFSSSGCRPGQHGVSGTRLLANVMGNTNMEWRMHSYPSLPAGTPLFVHDTGIARAAKKIGTVIYDVDKFLVMWNDAAKIYLSNIADSDAYSLTAITDITPSVATNFGTYFIDIDGNSILLCGYIVDKFESDFTPGDATKNDTWIKLVAK
jgi:hypothetical protein